MHHFAMSTLCNATLSSIIIRLFNFAADYVLFCQGLLPTSQCGNRWQLMTAIHDRPCIAGNTWIIEFDDSQYIGTKFGKWWIRYTQQWIYFFFKPWLSCWFLRCLIGKAWPQGCLVCFRWYWGAACQCTPLGHDSCPSSECCHLWDLEHTQNQSQAALKKHWFPATGSVTGSAFRCSLTFDLLPQ